MPRNLGAITQVSVFLLSTAAFADGNAVCVAENSALAGVGAKYKPQFDQISQDGQKVGDDAKKKDDLSVDFDVKFKEQHWIFDLPSVTMKDQRIVLTLPQVTMRTKDMSFDVPETKMVTIKTGQYPEVTCDHAFIPSCTVKWSNTYADVPQVTMVTHHFSMDLPDVKMDETDIIMGIPEFKMERQDWYVNIPEFTLKKIEVAGVPIYNDFKKKGDELQARGQEVKRTMNAELIDKTHALYACLRVDLSNKKDAALKQGAEAVRGMKNSMENLKANGIDPSAVKIKVDGTEKPLTQAETDLETSVAGITTKFDDTASKLDQDEKAAISKFATS